MSANVSGLVNLCITCNDTEVEIAYYIAVSHDHYFPTNVKVLYLSVLNTKMKYWWGIQNIILAKQPIGL